MIRLPRSGIGWSSVSVIDCLTVNHIADPVMLNAIRWITLCAIFLLVLLVCASMGLALFALEDEPEVSKRAPAEYITVAEGKAFVKRIMLQIESTDESGTLLVISERELDQLSQLGAHTFKSLGTDFDIDGSAINAAMSVQLPRNPFGRYLNMGAQIQQSRTGLAIDRLTIGPINVPARWVLPLGARLVDVLFQDQQASLILESISGVHVAGDTVLLSIEPPPDIRAHLEQAVSTLQNLRLPAGEQERVVHYYSLLVNEGARYNGGSQSLSEYLYPLMEEAASRSDRGSAVAENRAALWALIIYFSDGEFEMLIGELVSSQRELVRSPSDVTLLGRQDLVAHFLTSAGITLASQQGISIAAGEFKELLDSGNDTSGFSFIDMAADRAGMQFAISATANEEDARWLQEQMVANSNEVNFFPEISGLREGLSDAQFRQQYGDLESERYAQEVALIEQRIAGLLIYRLPPRPEH
jgi:hypothetical protein